MRTARPMNLDVLIVELKTAETRGGKQDIIKGDRRKISKRSIQPGTFHGRKMARRALNRMIAITGVYEPSCRFAMTFFLPLREENMLLFTIVADLYL